MILAKKAMKPVLQMIKQLQAVRCLKNIVGMYIVNRVNQEQTNPLPITEVVELAKKGQDYQEVFDPTQNKFLSPKNSNKPFWMILKRENDQCPKILASYISQFTIPCRIVTKNPSKKSKC